MPRRTPQRRRRQGKRIVAQHYCRIPGRPAPPHRVREQGSVTSDTQYPQNLPLQIDFARHFANSVTRRRPGLRRRAAQRSGRRGTVRDTRWAGGRHWAMAGAFGASGHAWRNARLPRGEISGSVFLRAAERRCCSNPGCARVSRKTLVHAPLPCAVTSQQGCHPFARAPKRRNRRSADPGNQTGNVSCRS